MITNDMNHLAQDSSCIYALFLNKGGRVLFDSIIFKTSSPEPDKESFLIECDSSVALNLAKHLKLYRVRRKIDISVSEEHNIWCLKGKLEKLKPSEDVSIFSDPRLKDIGYRIITKKDFNLMDSLSGIEEGSLDDYTSHRYKLGVCEGTVDLIPEKSLPLESNCDFMHGVSFHKGCYIGQELTARTHHTGVIRKRLMPLTFDNQINFKPEEPNDVKNESSTAVGKVRNVIGRHGLGLLRIEQVLAAKQLSLNENRCHTERPSWWPVEAEKTSQLSKG